MSHVGAYRGRPGRCKVSDVLQPRVFLTFLVCHCVFIDATLPVFLNFSNSSCFVMTVVLVEPLQRCAQSCCSYFYCFVNWLPRPSDVQDTVNVDQLSLLEEFDCLRGLEWYGVQAPVLPSYLPGRQVEQQLGHLHACDEKPFRIEKFFQFLRRLARLRYVCNDTTARTACAPIMLEVVVRTHRHGVALSTGYTQPMISPHVHPWIFFSCGDSSTCLAFCFAHYLQLFL